MKQIVQGVLRFQEHVYPTQHELFHALAKKQEPKVLLFTCVDSRVDPALLTQSQPGSLFVSRNIGNIVPPHGTPDGSVASILEYAIGVLHIEHIVICGHSDCGAMKGLLDPKLGRNLPAVTAWLHYAERARRSITLTHEMEGGEKLLRAITEQSVIAQLDALKTYPEVASALANRKLAIHGWYYDIGAGAVFVYDPNRDSFVPLADSMTSASQA